MQLSESLKIVDRLEQVFATFKPSAEGKELWCEELRDTLGGYTCDQVWPLIRQVMREECYTFPPTPFELLGKVRYKLYNASRDQRRQDQKQLEQTEEPGLTPEKIAANVQRVADMVAAATPKVEEEPDLLTRARGKSCDDLETDSLTKPMEG